MRHPEYVRHIGSLLLAAVFGPAVFLLTGTGLSAFETARRVSFIDDPLSPAAALGALLLAGLLYGVLVMARLSPLGPGLTGIAFLGMSGWALAAPDTYAAAFARLDVHMGGSVGQWGLGFLFGLPLLATLTSPRRWRRNALPVPVVYPPPQPAPYQPQQQYPPQYRYPSVDVTLPDVAAPSLRYPADVVPPGKPAKDPLPKRTPSQKAALPPVPTGPPQPVTLLSAPTEKVSTPGSAPPPPKLPIVIDDEATVIIDDPGNMKT